MKPGNPPLVHHRPRRTPMNEALSSPVIANQDSWRRAQAECHTKAHAIPSAEQAQAGVTGQVVGIGCVTLGFQTDKASDLIGHVNK